MKKCKLNKNYVGSGAYKVSNVWKLGAHLFTNETDIIFRIVYYRDKKRTYYIELVKENKQEREGIYDKRGNADRSTN